MGILVRTELMRINRPPYDISLPFQQLSLFSNRSSMHFHSLFVSLRWWIGIPKYVKGKVPNSHPNNCLYASCSSLALPKQNNSFLWKLIFNPVNCSNKHNTSFMFLTFAKSCSMKMIVSSPYYRIDTPPSTR